MASSFSIACACSAALILAGCHRETLPVIGTVPAFTLTAQDGSQFNSSALAGKIWIADFIFTNCPGPCPRMTSQMHRLQQQFASKPELRFVSFTVDPLRDTPAVLKEYAGKFHADPAQWTFLTGPIPVLNNLSKKVFMLGDIDGKTFEHSTRFMLVDGKGQIRGAYLTSEPEGIPNLITGIKTLLKETS